MEGLIEPYGHASLRLSATTFLIARNGSGAWVDSRDLVELETALTERTVKDRGLYSEVFIHSAMYQEHAGIGAVVHTHSPSAVALGTLRGRSGRVLPTTNRGANLGNFIPVFSEIGLIQSAAMGRKVARALKGQNGVLLRGHGAVTVGATLEQAVLRAIYLELEARSQMASRQAGTPVFFRARESDLFKETRAVAHAWEYFAEKLREQNRRNGQKR